MVIIVCKCMQYVILSLEKSCALIMDMGKMLPQIGLNVVFENLNMAVVKSMLQKK